MLDLGTPTRVSVPQDAAPEPVGVPGCPNCGSQVVSQFCAECGERQPSSADYSLRHIVLEAYAEFVNLDGRLWRSIVALLSKPGLLAAEYFAGRRGRYVRPFSLFVFLNVAFFFVQPRTNLLNFNHGWYVQRTSLREVAEQKQRALGISDAEFRRRFDARLDDQKKSALLVAIPLFALALGASYARSGHLHVEHLVFSVHAYAFLLFLLLLFATVVVFVLGLLQSHVPAGRPVWRALDGELGVDTFLFTAMVGYLALGMRRFYGTALLPAVARATAMFFVIVILLFGFQRAIFFTTVATL